MTIDTQDLLNSIIESLNRIHHIKPEELPNIDLYMDQVTTFMEQRLRSATRNPKEDKILTKTMINNYAKNDLLPSPNKKKYSTEHILLLIFIYYMKGVMSISDIQALFTPLNEKYFGTDKEFNLQDIYNEVFSMEYDQIDSLKKDIIKKYRTSEKTFAEVPEDEREFLQLFSFICLLCYDVYVKKLLIEKIIDGMAEEKQEKDTKEKEKK
ncbi:MAG: DUF1836 domain-containing protein [Lachnospiraceae bacterium]|nr:DUF1836 domain-containing protein [Lachnospiraceae bacterium]